MIDCNEWRAEKRHECTNMGKVKRLELWWQLYRTSLPVWDFENFRPMDFCWHECTNCLMQEVGNYKMQYHQMQTITRLGHVNWTLWNSPASSILNSVGTQRNSSAPAVVFHIWRNPSDFWESKRRSVPWGQNHQSIHQYLARPRSSLPGKTYG